MKQFLKQCSKCRKQKWNSEFSKNKTSSDGLQSWCTYCVREYQENDPKRKITIRKDHLKSKFNLTIEGYELILKSQKGICKICKQPETAKDRNGDIRRLCVDHNHETDRIRGLLCDKCNVMLGRAEDNPEILKQAIKYLEES